MFHIFNRKCSFEESGLPGIMKDRHSHILYGVDDGVKTAEESVQLLDWLEDLGLGELWLTPHVMEDIPNSSGSLRARFSELDAMWHGKTRLHLAAEYMMDNLFGARLEAEDLLLMEDDMVLVETSTWEPPYNMDETLDRILKAGLRPVLAHPERYRYMDMKDYGKMTDRGVLLQLNIPSVLGAYGDHVQRKAERLLSDGMYTFSGSDCHSFRMLASLYSAKVLDRKCIDRIAALSS